MVDKCSSYSKMTVFELLDSEREVSAVGNNDRILQSKFFVV